MSAERMNLRAPDVGLVAGPWSGEAPCRRSTSTAPVDRLGGRIRTTLAVNAALVASLIWSGPAHADLASTMHADLVQAASAVPAAQVSVGAPVGQETQMTGTTFAHVSFTAPAGNPLAGLIDAPSDPQYITEATQAPVWELAAIEAAKHALAAGNVLAGLSLTENLVGQPAPPGPDLIVSLHNREILSQPPATMPIDDVRSKIKSALPPWASNPMVAAVNDAAGERAVTVTLALPRLAFGLLDVPSALGTLAQEQHDLSAQGAGIGRVVLKVLDSSTGDPLYVAGVDGFMGFGTSWVSPLVQGLMGDTRSADGIQPEVNDVASDPAGYAQGLPPSPP